MISTFDNFLFLHFHLILVDRFVSYRNNYINLTCNKQFTTTCNYNMS
jgi:hypothetical protein